MRINRFAGFVGVLLSLTVGAAVAGSDDELIALDKKWGEAGMAGDTDTVATLLADDLVYVSENGVGGKAEELADNEPAPEGTTYQPSDYTVMWLDDNTAIMTHSGTSEDGNYSSLHVWSNKSGSWQVIATAGVPRASE